MKALGALLFLIAFVVSARVIPVADTVLGADGSTRLLGIDPYFHLRQAQLAVSHFPALPEHDLQTNYPWGRRVEGGGLYDIGVAAGARLRGAEAPDDPRVARTAAWSPVVLLALALVVLFAIGRRVAGGGVAIGACALWAAYPGQSLARTLLGFADHHAAEILLTLLVALTLHRALVQREPPGALRRWLPDWLHAAPLVALVFTWRGAPLHVLLVGVVCWLAISVRVGAGGSPMPMARAAWRVGSAAFLTVAIIGWQWPWLVVDTRLWNPVRVALAALSVAPVGYAILLRLGLRLPLPAALVAALGVGAVAAGAVFALRGIEIGRELALILIGPKPELIREHAAVGWGGLWREVGPVGVVALLGSVPALVAALRGRSQAGDVVPWVFAAFFTLLWWRTGDYGYMPPALLALVAAMALGSLLPELPGRSRPVAVALSGLLFLVPLWPLRWVQAPWPASEEWRELVVAHDGWYQAMAWLREQEPTPEEAAAARPGYPAFGVTTAWDRGNLVSALGQQAPVFDRYPTRRSSRWLFAQDELAALPLLCPWCRSQHTVRFVVIDAKSAGENFLGQVRSAGRRIDDYALLEGSFELEGRQLPRWTFGPRFDRSMASQLYLRDGNGLRHFRLLHESEHQSYSAYQVDLSSTESSEDFRGAFDRTAQSLDREEDRERMHARVARGGAEVNRTGYDYDARVLASVKTFEAVPGAVLTGFARPGMLVVAQLDLLIESTGRRLAYIQGTSSDRDGRFGIVVPYPTESLGARSAVSPVGTYQLRVISGSRLGAEPRSAEVSEAQVQSGAIIELGRIGGS